MTAAWKLLKREKNCYIAAIDKYDNFNKNEIDEYFLFDLNNGLPDLDYKKFNYILLLDVIEHLRNPEKCLINLKEKIDINPKIKVIVSTPNIAFIIIRLMLLFGSFNYGKKGILDKTHTRLFTFSSFQNLLKQSGFKIENVSGIPAPFPLVTGNNFLGNFLIKLNKFFIFFSKRLFSYQIYCEITPQVSIEFLLDQAKSYANEKK